MGEGHQLDQVDVDLPSLVDIADEAHGVEAVEEVDDHEDDDGEAVAEEKRKRQLQFVFLADLRVVVFEQVVPLTD